MKSINHAVLSLFAIFLVYPAAPVSAQIDSLPSWNDCSAKQTRLAFVARVTEPGSQDFVPQPERIAVFDNDGTLWPESPVPFQFAFALAELERRVVDEPQLKADPMVQAALAGDLAKLLEGPRHDGLLRILALTHAGMTTDQFQDRVDSRQYRFERRDAVFFVDRIEGVMLLQAGDQSPHHPAELFGLGSGKVVGLEGVFGQVVELVVGVFGGLGREVVVDDFPIALPIAGEVVAAMR